MAQRYKLTRKLRFVNSLIKALLRVGLAPRDTYLLTVRGHNSGRLYSTPVTLVKKGGDRWLVSPYGEVAWVANVRAAQRVTLSRGSRAEQLNAIEAGAEESAEVLRTYIQ